MSSNPYLPHPKYLKSLAEQRQIEALEAKRKKAEYTQWKLKKESEYRDRYLKMSKAKKQQERKNLAFIREIARISRVEFDYSWLYPLFTTEYSVLR